MNQKIKGSAAKAVPSSMTVVYRTVQNVKAATFVVPASRGN
jgi:hypothetical protein